MRFEEVVLKIPCGYEIIEKSKTVDLFTAYELLKSRRQRHYTEAVRNDDNATIFWHSIKCPHCGKETPAYYHYLHEKAQKLKISTKQIDLWIQMQLSIFQEKDKKLQLQIPKFLRGKFECEHCGNISTLSKEKDEIIIGHSENVVYISRKINKFSELVELKWLHSIDYFPVFPLEEKILFDSDKGTTHIQLLDNNKVIYSLDITNIKFPTSIGPLEEAINKNIVIKRVLKRFFQEIWQEKIPFKKEELSLQNLILITRFIDFPRNFFDAIPLSEANDILDLSFSDIAKKLHTPMGAMELLKNYNLPNVKSLKRILTAKSGLFFYLEECAVLYDILNDINLLCKILKSNTAYWALAMLHNYPNIKYFYRDYSKIKTPLTLSEYIINNLKKLNDQAILYYALSDSKKKLEIKKWEENIKTFDSIDSLFLVTYLDFSTIICPFPEDIKDCTIGKFHFKWLKNTADYQEAGRKLHNCLTEWHSNRNPVIAIYKSKKIVAAMEICDRMIIQALEKHNEKIDRTSDLYSAIEKWSEKYSVEINPCCEDDLL